MENFVELTARRLKNNIFLLVLIILVFMSSLLSEKWQVRCELCPSSLSPRRRVSCCMNTNLWLRQPLGKSVTIIVTLGTTKFQYIIYLLFYFWILLRVGCPKARVWSVASREGTEPPPNSLVQLNIHNFAFSYSRTLFFVWENGWVHRRCDWISQTSLDSVRHGPPVFVSCLCSAKTQQIIHNSKIGISSKINCSRVPRIDG